MDDIHDSEHLAELESLLYSQIHHSAERENDPATSNVDPLTNIMSANVPNRPRYYGYHASGKVSVASDQSTDALPTKDEQFEHMPVIKNNVLLLPPNPALLPNLTKKQREVYLKRYQKAKEKILKLVEQKPDTLNKLSKGDMRKVVKLQRRQRYIERKKERLKLAKEQKLIDQYNESLKVEEEDVAPKPEIANDVIELSETDEDEIVPVEQIYDLIILSSDDETLALKQDVLKDALDPLNTSHSDEVECLGTPAVELITIESDSPRVDSQLMKPPEKSHGTPKSRKQANECPDLLNTPESSNDFLDNSIEVLQSDKFNFSFHGNDLDADKVFAKPRKLAEMYESESSCSASDISTPLKSDVFNELEFEAQPAEKELFNEANLESFSNFITPKRKAKPSSPTQEPSTSSDSVKVKSVSVIASGGKDDSDSSSESEYGDESQSKRPHILPSLSYFEEEEHHNIPTKMDMKNKTKAKESVVEKPETKEDEINTSPSVKKVKKRKQKDTIESPKKSIVARDDHDTKLPKRRKKQKSKSDTELEDMEDETPIKTKAKCKSDTEMDFHEEPISENESPRKRQRKRESTSDGDVTPSHSKGNRRKTESFTEFGDYANESFIHIDDDDSDLKLIEEEPPACIDLSDSGDFFKSSEDECFHVEELRDLKTNIDISNIKIEKNSVNNAWNVQSEADFVLNPSAADRSEHPSEDPEPPSEVAENTTEADAVISWNIPGYDADKARAAMKYDDRKWKILDKDRYCISRPERGPRCNRCRQVGHMAKDCNHGALVCWLCGNKGHQESRCPNTACTRCGRHTRFFTTFCGQCKSLEYYTCKTCKTKGHPEKLCPDFWRRYYATTENGPIVQPHPRYKAIKERWCSGCGQQGHFEHTCNYYNRTHIPCKPYILRTRECLNTEPPLQESRMVDKNQDSRGTTENSTNNNNEIPNAVLSSRRRMEVKLDIDMHVSNMLRSPRGKKFLDQLNRLMHFEYVFTAQRACYAMTLKGKQDSVTKIYKVFQELSSNPLQNSCDIILTDDEIQIFNSELGKKAFTSLFRTYNIKYEVYQTASINKLSITGDIFDLLMTKLKFAKTLPDIEKKFNSHVTYHIPEMLYKELESRTNHPFMQNLSSKCHVTWKLANKCLIISGTKDDISVAKKVMGNITCPTLTSASALVQQIDAFLLRRAELKNRKDLAQMFEHREYENLNIIMFGIYNVNKQSKLIKKLCSYRKELSKVLVASKWYEEQMSHIFNFFKKVRAPQTYTDFLRRIAPKDMAREKNIPVADHVYSFDSIMSSDCANAYEFCLVPSHMKHLIESDEGAEFIHELNTFVSLELVEAENKIILFRTTYPRVKDFIKKVNEYFQQLQYVFPVAPTEIYNDLTLRLANVAVDYYFTDCKQLYRDICQSNEDTSSLYSRLHALLFVKHEFLDGIKHVDTVKFYLEMLCSMDAKSRLSTKGYREVKSSALYLFCPYRMNLNYELIVSLTVRPIVPTLSDNYSQLVENLKGKFRLAREFYIDQEEIQLIELSLFEQLIDNSETTKSKVEIVAAYFEEKFPML